VKRVLILSFLLAVGSTTLAQAVPGRLFDAMSWRFAGPFRGGRVLAVAGTPGKPFTYYFGAVDGGVFKTADGGTTWTPLFQHEPTASIGALAVAPSNPRIIYAGTGECAIRSDITYGDGMYRSDDGGKTWRHIGLTGTRHIGSILISPTDPGTVLVAALGHAYGPNPERGVYLTTDGGKTWKHTLFVDAKTGCVDLARDPGRPDLVYAVAWNTHRTPWFQYAPVEGAGSAIYRSEDGGRTWEKLPMTGLPDKGLGRMGIAVAPGTPGPRLYAIVSAGRRGGVYRSDDGGVTWRRTSGDSRLLSRGWYFGRIVVDPKNPDVVYVPHISLYKSTDGGARFTVIKGSPGGDDFHALWIDPDDPSRMVLGSDQGAAVSVDGGAHWTTWYNQPTAQIYHLATDDAFPYRIYASQQDSGAFAIVSRSYTGRITNCAWETTGGGESGYVIPRPGDPDIVYGSSAGGRISRFDARTHQSVNISPALFNSFWKKPSEVAYNYPWNTALAVSPFDPDTLYVGAQVVFRSTDMGDHWSIISPTLTGRKKNAECAGEPTPATAAACGYGCISALAASPKTRGQIWAGTTDSRLWVTADDGARWRNVTPPGLGPWSRIERLEPSPFDGRTLYAAVDRHRMDDFRPYIYATHDLGKTWREIDVGIPDGAYVRVVRADPFRRGLLYAGTETGVYVSFDDGAHWQSLQLDLPTASVRDLAVHGDDLIAGTHGRGLWALDDVTPLRQASAAEAAEAAHLYEPAPAYRLRVSLYHGEPVPPDEPYAKNPPTGAVIDYVLKDKPEGAVTLSVYDAAGKLVRRFSSDDIPPKMPEAHFRNVWESPPDILPARAGHNRFVWDLRYTPPRTPRPEWGWTTVPGEAPRGEQAPLVLPGRYRLVLTVDGHDYPANLTVKADPDVKTPLPVLEEQVRLGLAMRDAADRALSLIAQSETFVDAAEKAGRGTRARRILDVLERHKLEQTRKRLLRLIGTVGSADTAPPAPVHSAALDLIHRVEETGDALRSLLRTAAEPGVPQDQRDRRP
jgi:photosystem II stability/assembly factor-like uncharacterized protein